MKIKSVAFAFFAAIFSVVCSAGSVSFYVVAHEDDWQLFMNPNAYDDVNSAYNDKTVFVYVTAGDAGNRANNTYYSAREDGANRSVRFMADADAVGSTSTASNVTINGNSVRKVVYKDTVSYFLRLPDGNGDGSGFQANNYQSIKKLYSGEMTSITTILGSLTSPTSATKYDGWSELVGTLIAIINLEKTGLNPVFVNMPDPVSGYGHSDHLHVGLATEEAANTMSCINKVYFIHNDTGFMAINLTTDQIINEAATWGAMTTGLTERGYNSTFEPVHKWAVGKNYFRVSAGSGNCP